MTNNITQLLQRWSDGDQSSDITYIIMEYVEAQSLHELISSSSLDAEQIISIAIQACQALAEVHSRHITHRDIKPANILVTRRGVVKLLDFGIARPFSGSVFEQTATFDYGSGADAGEVAGTIHYMSPEQIRGESLDERTDIFSFGVLLYEMITGRVPFAGNRIIEIATSILKEKPADFDPTSKGLPPQIRDVITRCLEKDRERRFSSLLEIKDTLKELRQQSRPVTDRQPANAIEFSYRPATPAVPIILVLPFEVLGSGAEESLGPQNSSVRFKENVELLNDDFQKILALKPKSFTYKDTGFRGIGYMAEDLDELKLNELVGYDADGKALSINYKMMPVYLLEVVKEQQRMLRELKAEVTELKASHKK